MDWNLEFLVLFMQILLEFVHKTRKAP